MAKVPATEGLISGSDDFDRLNGAAHRKPFGFTAQARATPRRRGGRLANDAVPLGGRDLMALIRWFDKKAI